MTTENTAPPVAPPVEDVKEATAREAVLKTLLDQVKEAHETAKTDVQYLLDKTQKATGGTRFDATLPDGPKVGSVSITGGEPAAQITDEEAFTAWVRKTYPAESVTRIVKTVQAAFTAKILDEMTAAGTPRIVDGATGELHEVPGVEVKATRKRSHALTFTRKSKAQPKPGRELVIDAWRSGALAELVLPALAPAPQTEQEDAA